MPIVVDWTPSGVPAELAFAAGSAQGRAERMGQQRSIDANLVQQLLGQKHQTKMVKLGQDFSREMAGREMSQNDRRQQQNVDLARERLKLERDEFEGQMGLATTKMSMAQEEAMATKRQRQGYLASLEEAYAGRPKDLAYEQAIAEIETQGRLNDRTASAIGILTETERRQRSEGQVQGTMDSFEPRTESERRQRRLLEMGDFETVGKGLARAGNVKPSDRDFAAVTDTQIQLEGWLRAQDRPEVIESARERLAAQGVPPTVLASLDAKLAEIRQQELVVKAPMAMDTAMAAFERQGQMLMQEMGRPLTPVESSRVLGEAIRRTTASMGLDLRAFNDFVLSQEDLSAQATNAARQMLGEAQRSAPAEGEMSGSEETYGRDMPAGSGSSLLEALPGLRLDGTKLTLPSYLVPVKAGDPGMGMMVDTRTGRTVAGEAILAEILAAQGMAGQSQSKAKPKER